MEKLNRKKPSKTRPITTEMEAHIRRNIKYDPITGLLTWKEKSNRKIVIGSKVGGRNEFGHLVGNILGRGFMLHRVAWFLHYGAWPGAIIDHINRVPSDNRICNLREVTCSESMENISRHKDSKSGVLGVHAESKKNRRLQWKSSIQAQGRRIELGSFATIEEAQAAYLKAKQEMHPSSPICNSGKGKPQ